MWGIMLESDIRPTTQQFRNNIFFLDLQAQIYNPTSNKSKFQFNKVIQLLLHRYKCF